MTQVRMTKRVQIFPDTDQRTHIDQTLCATRAMYNYMLAMQIDTSEAWSRGDSPIHMHTFSECSAMIPKLKETDEFSFCKSVDSSAIIYALRELDTLLAESVSDATATAYPPFKTETEWQSYTTQRPKTAGTGLILPKIPGIINTDGLPEMDGAMVKATIRKSPSNAYYVSFGLKPKETKPYSLPRLVPHEKAIRTYFTKCDKLSHQKW